MGFLEAVQSCFNNFVTFSGRARRAEYWWFGLFCFGIGLVATLLDHRLTGSPLRHTGPIVGLVSLAIFLPSLAVTVRRLHDVNRSGWWLLIVLVPLIGVLILLYLILLYWTIKRGDAGSNTYGPDPIGYASSIPPISRL